MRERSPGTVVFVLTVSCSGREIDPYSDTGTDEPKFYSFMGSDEDGEIREIPDDEVHYYECPVKN